jgi:hypothetical protein
MQLQAQLFSVFDRRQVHGPAALALDTTKDRHWEELDSSGWASWRDNPRASGNENDSMVTGCSLFTDRGITGPKYGGGEVRLETYLLHAAESFLRI